MDSRLNMAVVASKYQTVNTVFTLDGTTVQRILAANPRRYYVRFSNVNAIGLTYPLLPGPPVSSAFGPIGTVGEWELKYTDAPSIVTGEWYCGGGVGGVIIITESIYTE